MIELNIQSACEILEINYNGLSSFNNERLKKQYYKLALQYHPDKHNNSSECTTKFQEINSAYNYLQKEVNNSENMSSYFDDPYEFSSFNKKQSEETNNTSEQENPAYMYLLSVFITSIAKSAYNNTDIFTTVLKDIIIGCKQISLKLFEGLSKEMTLEVFSFLLKYQRILYIKEETMIKLKEVVLEKYSNAYLFILNPSIDDLFDSNIYKLNHDGVTYFVPLWHSELYYDVKDDNKDVKDDNKDIKDDNKDVNDDNHNKNGGEIIVNCVPDLGENIFIDELNNIHVTINVKLNEIDMNNKNDNLLVKLGKQTIEIPYNKLMIKSLQYYTIRKKGISKINEVDIYYIDDKADIIVKILLAN